MFAEIAQGMDMLIITAAAFNQRDIAVLRKGLDIVDRAFAPVNQLDKIKNAFIYVKKRHVTAEAACQGSSGNNRFLHDFSPLQVVQTVSEPMGL
jgi:hypothetical protein